MPDPLIESWTQRGFVVLEKAKRSVERPSSFQCWNLIADTAGLESVKDLLERFLRSRWGGRVTLDSVKPTAEPGVRVGALVVWVNSCTLDFRHEHHPLEWSIRHEARHLTIKLGRIKANEFIESIDHSLAGEYDWTVHPDGEDFPDDQILYIWHCEEGSAHWALTM